MILSSVLLTIIIAGPLTFAWVSLMHLSSTRSKKQAPLAEAASSPVFVGTEHPVPIDPTSLRTIFAKHKSSNPVTAPTPQPSVAVETNSRRDVEPPSRAAREKVERAREEAERERAHVENLYQKHLISQDAYKMGQAEYQYEMAKYQDQIAKYRSEAPGAGGTDE